MKIRQQRTIEKNICKKMILLSFCMILMVSMAGCGNKRKENLTITNVSYDPTREFYEKYNKDFIKYYKDKYGKKVEVIQSHGGSGSQARSVVEGSNGDVVTLALEHDISLIEQTGLINKGWQKRFSNDSAPYTSTIVFLVRKGNKKSIKDWKDLIKKGVEVITPDPKSSGGACWNFLAAYGYALDTYRDQKKEEQFLTKLYQNVSVMDSGARGSTTTFVENKKGDVLILTKQLGSGIVNTAVKAQMASEAAGKEAVAVMTQLNKKAREILDKFTIHACTDVTGFGLLGHCGEMASASRAKIELWPKDIAYIEGAKEYAQMGLIPGGAYRNRNHVAQLLEAGNTDEMYVDLLSDPQTSGGLLAAVPEEEKDAILEEFDKAQMETKVSVVGKVIDSECEEAKIYIR